MELYGGGGVGLGYGLSVTHQGSVLSQSKTLQDCSSGSRSYINALSTPELMVAIFYYWLVRVFLCIYDAMALKCCENALH